MSCSFIMYIVITIATNEVLFMVIKRQFLKAGE